MRRVLPPLALALGLGLAATPAGGAEADAARRHALLVLRVLAYDHNLVERAGDTATLVLVYNPTSEESRAEHAALLEGLDAIDKLRVGGLPLRVVSHAYGDPEIFRAKVARLKPAALYLCLGLRDAVDTVSRATRAGQVLSFGGTEAYARSGLSVAVVIEEKPRIVINLAASRAEGAAFDAGLLKLAEVLR